MFQRPGEQELIEQFAVPGARDSPTEPVEHLGAMIAPRAAFPTSIGAEQFCALAAADTQTVSEAVDRGGRTRSQLVRYSTSHGSVHSWTAAPMRFS
jgi:hypothetical protein